MERILPIDLERAELKTSVRGYDREHVREYLNRAAREIELLRGELATAQQRLDKQKTDLETYVSQENALKDALLLAQKSAEETRNKAQQDAETIIEEAVARSKEITGDVEGRLNDLRWELENLRIQKQKFVTTFRTLLDQHVRELAEHSGLAVIEGQAEAVEFRSG